jgi:hypothetical protein
MPLEDGYQTEKWLNQIATEIADGITEMFKELHIIETTSFCLFVVDHKTGTLQYISDLDRMVADKMLKLHISRSENN